MALFNLSRFKDRRAISRVVLVLGALFVASRIWPNVRHETNLLFTLGPEHEKIVEVRIAYIVDGEESYGVTFHYPSGAPSQITHRLGLPHGRYQIKIELKQRDGKTKTLVRSLRAPVDSTVQINAKE
jgi:hypothetical protein